MTIAGLIHAAVKEYLAPLSNLWNGHSSEATETAGNHQPGELVPDGTVYAGISPDTGKPLYTTSKAFSTSLTYTFDEALRYASNLDANGHNDWRLPTMDELNVLFNNRAAIGGFNVTGSDPGGWYWSSSEDYDYGAWAQRFSDGYQSWNTKIDKSSLRCVR
jgi:hypothetical protein